MVVQSLWMLLSAFLFTVMALFVKLSTDYYDVMEIVFYRSLLGVVLVGATLWGRGISIGTRYPWRHLRRCLCGTLCISLGVYVLGHLSLGLAQTLNYSSPLFFALFTVVASVGAGVKVEWGIVLAIVVGFLGVVLMMRPDLSSVEFWATLVGVASAFLGATADWFIRDLSVHKEPKERIVFYFTLTGTLLGLAVTVCSSNGFHAHTALSLSVLVLVGLSATAAQLALTTAWTYGHPLLNSIYQFSGILFAVLFGMIFFGERPDVLMGIGMIVIFGAGVSASVLRLRTDKKG